VRGIIETPVMAVYLAREYWASLVSVAAHRDHCLDLLLQELIKMLRAVRADVESDLLHGGHSQ
jgi:hypothetical protein